MPINLVVLDLDGTLVQKIDNIPLRTQQAVKIAMEAGVYVTIATGRDYQSTMKVASQLKLNAPLICYQGALLQDYRIRRKSTASLIALDLSRRLIKLARANRLPLVMFMPDGNFTEFPTDHLDQHVVAGGTTLTIVNNLLGLLNEKAQPIKFLFVQPEAETESVYELIANTFGNELTVLRSGSVYIEAFRPDVSKGNALTVLADQLNIPLSETMAIGDHDNDISMLRAAGFSVAMENASNGAKAAAQVIAPSVTEEGVAWAIERYVLEQDND